MKKIASALMALTISVAALAGNGKDKTTATTYVLDVKESSIQWKGEKVTGEHSGKLKFKSGNIVMDADKIAIAKFVTDMNSITCSDLDGEYADKLIGHLKSDDFFGVEKNPTSTFELTSFKSTGAGTGEMTGKLTIKGKTEVVKVPVSMTESNGVINLKGDMVFDRTKFDIRYGSGSFFDDLGDKTIYDDVEFKFNIVAKNN